MNGTEDNFKRVHQLAMAGAAIISFAVFLYHLFAPSNGWPEIPENAIYWFLITMVAMLLPYISEVTYKDLHILFNKLNKSTQQLVILNDKLELARFRFDNTREELIHGYFEYLKALPKNERIDKKLYLTRLYIQGMSISEMELTKMLAEVPGVKCKISEELTKDTLSAIEQVQIKFNLIPDGVFGFQTYAQILELKELL